MFRKLISAASVALLLLAPPAQATVETGGSTAGSYSVPSGQITSVNFAASPYSIQPSDKLLLVDTTGGAVTLVLPDPTQYYTLQIKDAKGNFGTNAVTLQQHASEKIEGIAASLVLSANWGNYKLQADGTNWNKVSAASNFAKASWTSSGTYTWTAPAGVTQVVACGRGGSGGGSGGGAGGGGSTAAGAAGGGAGGNGGSVSTTCYPATVTPGTGYTITIGAGGTAGAGGIPAAANASGSTGGYGTVGGAGGNTSFGSLITFIGGTAGANGNPGSLSTGGAAGYPGISVFQSNPTGGAGGAANTAGGNGNTQYVFSPFGSYTTGASGGTAGGTGGGGGGGGAAGIMAGDANAQAATAGGAGGASGANGNSGVTVNAACAGCGGSGGPGGGGGGLKASTGSQGGAGAAGGVGSTGYLTLTWQE